MSTLVFHHGALGDSVMIWPVLRALSPVTLIAPREKALLAQRFVPGVRAVDGDAPDFSRLFSGAAAMEISDEMTALLCSAERVFSFVSTGRDVWAANLRAIAPRAQLHFIPTRHLEGSPLPLIEQHLAHIVAPPAPPLPVRRNPDGPVLVHPGSGGREKRWPAAHFSALLDHLRNIGRPAGLVIGEVEREWMPRDLLERWRRKEEVIEPASLIELAEHLSRASVFVGNDSGPTHLAAQLGIPTVALFGPTEASIWRPVGPAVAVISPQSPREMTWLPLAAVIEAVARFS